MSRIYKAAFISVLSVMCAFSLRAEDENAHNSFSPYSLFGLGNMDKGGSAYNRTMGGVGIASRSRSYINLLNPAALASRDTLSFMGDISLSVGNNFYSAEGKNSIKNTFNISGIAFSFPIYKKSAFMVGLSPFSDVAFDYSARETSNNMAVTNIITHTGTGNGGIYQLTAGAGATFGNFSAGAQLLYYFGSIKKEYAYTFTSTSSNSILTGCEMHLNGTSAKLGVQYEKTLSNGLTLTAGLTHRLPTRLHGDLRNYQLGVMSSMTDTLRNDTLSLGGSKVRIASETGIGISLRRGDKWMVEADYVFSSWKSSNLDKVSGFASSNSNISFATSVSHSFRVGAEYTPNRNDIRYYLRRCAYRAGMYFDKAYFTAGGKSINTVGLTLGVTLPVFRLNNGLTLGVDMGQRGRTSGGLVRERYITFSVGFNIHDIWFRRPQYE